MLSCETECLYSLVTFEESILSIVPSALFLLLVGPRSVYLLKALDKAKRHSTYTPKLVRNTLRCAVSN